MPAIARRLLILAMLVDTLGSGLVFPFELLFGTDLVGLTLAETALGLSIGTGIGIIAGPIAGSLVDRFGPMRLVVTANLLSVAACAGLLLADGLVAFTAVSFVFATASRTFWAAYAPLAAAFVAADDLETWFGRFRATRYGGLAAGAAVASLALLAGRETGLRLVLGANALSYVVAICLFLSAAHQRQAAVQGVIAPRSITVATGHGSAIRDLANMGLATLNVADTLLITVPLLALPIFVLDQLLLPPWVPGVLAAVGTVAVAIPTFFAGRLSRGRRRLRLLAAAAALWSLGGLLMAAGAALPGVALVILPAGMILLGVGEAVYAPTADALPLVLAQPHFAGRYSALHQLAWGVSGTVAPILTAWLLGLGAHVVWGALSAAAALVAACYLWLERRLGVRTGVAGSRPGGLGGS